MQFVSTEIKKIIGEIMNLKEDEISENSEFIKDLGADLFDKLSIIMAFEEEFCLNIDDDEVQTIKTVGQVISCVSNKLKNKEFRRTLNKRHYTERLIKMMLMN